MENKAGQEALLQAALAKQASANVQFCTIPEPHTRFPFLHFPDDAAKDIAILDLSGRTIAQHTGIAAREHRLSLAQLAQGAYWVKASTEGGWKAKKLIVH